MAGLKAVDALSPDAATASAEPPRNSAHCADGSQKRALVVHLHYDDKGGAETFSFRIIGILQRRFNEVVVLHGGEAPDLEFWEARAGVRVDPDKVKFLQVRPPWFVSRFLAPLSSLQLLRYAFVVRAAQRMASGFDLVVSTFAECPIREDRMIQSIHIPIIVDDRESMSYTAHRMSDARRRLHSLYIFFVRKIMRFSRRRIARQLTWVNSCWTGEQFLRHYPGGAPRVIYLGSDELLTQSSPEWVEFAKRENNFVMVGRIVPSKRIEMAVEIVERLRARGHEIGLVVIGGGPAEYVSTVAELARTRPWLKLHSNPDRVTLEALVVRQKWGLHCFRFEHYGLAPAELQALGCITFIHDSGGQREIICNPAQRYADVDDAVEKIDAVLRAPETHAALLAEAARLASKHRAQDFIAGFASLIDSATG